MPATNKEMVFSPPRIVNNGPQIVETDYFDSVLAKEGMVFLSWNLDVARLLIPDSQLAMVDEMKTAEYAILSSGRWFERQGIDALELLFEDHTDSPFALQFASSQCDLEYYDAIDKREFPLAVMTRSGVQFVCYVICRRAKVIPCLSPWT